MGEQKVGIVIPVFNDWESAAQLVKDLRLKIYEKRVDHKLTITFVDDCSTQTIPSQTELSSLGMPIEVISLASNVGHQRAIMAGLKYVSLRDLDYVLVMDSDGEDTVDGVVRLLEKSRHHQRDVIVAQRGLRSEKLPFRIMYKTHKVIFRALIGKRLDFGNFVLLPIDAVQKVTSLADSSTHLPSSILRSGLAIVRVRIDRGSRYFGESKMKFEKLVAHSFASLAVFSDQIMVRLMIFSFFSTLVTSLAIVSVAITRIFSDIATPGWATATIGLLLIISFQILSFVGLGTLITLNLNSLKNLYLNNSEVPRSITSVSNLK